MRAPVIHVRGGSPQIPDGVAHKDGYYWVIDASVVADNADLDDAHMSKCTKYDTRLSMTGASLTGLPRSRRVPYDSVPSCLTGGG